MLALLPFISTLKGIPLSDLPAYISQGFSLLQHNLSLPLLYVFVNISFNISILYLLSISSAVVARYARLFESKSWEGRKECYCR